MNHRDIAALVAGLTPVIRDFVADAFKGIGERVAALETHEPVKGEKGDPGIAGEPGAEGKPGRDGVDGKDGAPGADGKDGVDGKDGAVGEKGLDGKDGRDGADGKDGAAGIDGKDGAPGRDGPAGEKGLDGKDGRDGQPGGPGSPGRDGLDGKDGAPGLDGKDGLGFDDMTVEHDGERGFTLKFSRGDQLKEFSFSLPIVIDRGVWKEGNFKRGDGVTWAGSFFIAQRDTSGKPETADCGWRLAVKRGRDGNSAYEVARKAGFAGTEREWLDSLRPKPAAPVKVGT